MSPLYYVFRSLCNGQKICKRRKNFVFAKKCCVTWSIVQVVQSMTKSSSWAKGRNFIVSRCLLYVKEFTFFDPFIKPMRHFSKGYLVTRTRFLINSRTGRTLPTFWRHYKEDRKFQRRFHYVGANEHEHFPLWRLTTISVQKELAEVPFMRK